MFKRMLLTDNERDGAFLETSQMLVISTKRPKDFPIGALRSFRNKWPAYGWTIAEHYPRDGGRTLIRCENRVRLKDFPSLRRS